MDEETIIKRAQEIFNQAKNFQQENYISQWEKNNDAYNSKFSVKDGKNSDVLMGQGKLFIPKTYSHTQRILVDILETFFFDPSEIVSLSNSKNIPYEVKETVKALLNYRLNGNPINFYQELYEACLDALKNKIGILKVYPQLRTEKIRVPVTDDAGTPLFNMDYEPLTKEVEAIMQYSPHIDCIPYEDVFFHPSATWKDYFKFPIVHRMKKTIDYLRQQGYKNLDDLQPADLTSDTIKQQRLEGSPFVNTSPVFKETSEVYIFEFWDFLDINGDEKLESCSYIMAGAAESPLTLIRDAIENTLPYQGEGELYNESPIVLGNAYPESHQLAGKSLPDIVEGLQRETNSIRNQKREAAAFAIRRPILVARGSQLDLMSLVNRKAAQVVLGDDITPSSIRELETQEIRGFAEDEGRNDQNFFEATSIPPNLLGASSSGDETATAVTQHMANANKKIQMVIRNLAQTLVIPALKKLLRLEKEYESDDFIAMVTGKILGWQQAADNMPTRNDIQGDFDLMVNTGINKQIHLNKLMMIMDRGIQSNAVIGQLVGSGVINPLAARFFNPQAVFNRMLNTLGEKDQEEFLIPAQQPPQGMEAKGIASQPTMPQGMDSEVTNMNPETIGGLNV